MYRVATTPIQSGEGHPLRKCPALVDTQAQMMCMPTSHVTCELYVWYNDAHTQQSQLGPVAVHIYRMLSTTAMTLFHGLSIELKPTVPSG
mmetsp:Transcript_40403/g.89742  ORF Transcript_40403/g.89742 Transcript_40403/m.89742 type:complete len:90 (-) Transcript_40403:1051-1320(-)